MSSYTCISCRVAFSDGEVQRAHYKTDWHRYNLKRKVADMPPVTAENFQERVLAQRAAAELKEREASVSQSCSTCNKRFSSANAYQNHLQSHKHQQAEKQALLAAQRKVEKMNEKNLEKGLGEEKIDHNEKNQALQLALKEEQKPLAPRQGAEERQRPEKPPRLLWFEEQAKRLPGGEQEQDGATAPDDEWDDIDDEDNEEEEEEEEEEEDEDMVEQEAGEPSASGGSVSAVPLPGSIPVCDCLFCPHHSHSLMKSLAHMTTVHSFFIPDLEFLIDLKGLIAYLGEKVGAGKVCLWCNEKGRSFYSTEAVQAHMTDKSHCKLLTDGDASLEFADFYDFRSSYPDRKEGEDQDMEDEDLPNDKNLEFDDDTLELTLPSGARIGHRSLMRYYKQRFGAPKAVTLAHNRRAVGRVLRQYRALGWGGGELAKTSFYLNNKDMQYVQKMKSKWMMKLGQNNNSTKQTHFRAQVMF